VLQSLFSLKIQGLKGVDNISIFAKIGMIFGLQGFGTLQQTLIGQCHPQDVVVPPIFFANILALN